MRSLRLAIALCLVAGVAAAQTNRGGISGTVFDATGGVLPGATVVVTNLGTNQSVTTHTSKSGTYSVSPLDPVVYRVSVEMPGFQKAVVEKVKVDTAVVATVDVRLKTGAITEEISVVAEAPLVNSQSGTASQTISERQIVEMPLNNRSVLDLAMTVGNVSGMAGTEDPELAANAADVPAPGFNLFINGGRAGSTSILADGARNSGVGIARAVVSFSPDTVQEFTVQTSNFAAEYGQTGGGVINMSTKQGTNQYQGLAYWYNRNPSLAAAPFTTAATNRPTSNRKQNQLGATLSGPLKLPGYDGHDRTFFFVAYEPRWYYDSYPYQDLVPTEAMRSGNFANAVSLTSGGYTTQDIAQRFGLAYTPIVVYNQFDMVGTQFVRRTPAAGTTFPVFPGNQIPANMIDATSLEVMKHLPKAGEYFMGNDGLLKNYNSSQFINNFEQRLTVRLDHQVSKENRLSARFTRIPIRGDRGRGDFEVGRDEVNSQGTDYSWSKQFLVTDTHTFSPSVINDFRFNYTYGRFTRNYSPGYDAFTGANWSKELGLPSITAGGISEFNTGMGWVGWSQSQQSENEERTFNITDNVTWVRGNKTWKAGFDIAQMQLDTTPMYGAPGGRYEFTTAVTNSALTSGVGGNPFASFLLGVYNTVSLRDTLITYKYRWQSYAGFVQNDWKLSPSLTLNLGLRYTLQLPRTEANDLQGLYLPELAKEYPLPTPVTLPGGQVITKTLVPPFAFSGRGGRSRYLTPIDYNGWEPRFGFAWVPKFDWNESRKLVVRGGYGLSHLPLTGMGRTPAPDFGATSAYTFQSLQANPSYVGRLSTNPPGLIQKTPEQTLQIPENGLVELQSLNIRGANAVSQNNRVPYIQSWSTSVAYELPQRTALEISYLGSKGTHLYYQPLEINTIPFDVEEGYRLAGLAIGTTVNDPLGRVDSNGRVLTYARGYLGAKYMGFAGLRSMLDASANSIRHAVSASLRRQHNKGFSYTVNYTYGKGFDNASQSGSVRFVDFNSVLSPGHVNFGADPSVDWSVSSYDIKHAASGSFLWDLPFGRGRRFLSSAPGFVDAILGGWSLSGVGRWETGPPLSVILTDGNGLTTQTRQIRPDLVPGVSLYNPRYSKDCPITAACEPYFNSAAFTRPALGVLGNAPRTFDEARWPSWETLDLAVQKNFYLGKDKRRRLQLRLDAINALNHPIFRNLRDSDAGNIYGYPSEAVLTTAEFNAWASYNGRGLIGTPEGNALKAASDNIILSNRVPGTVGLPTTFFAGVKVPEGFHSANVNEYNVTTTEGLKLYRMKQQYVTDRWGSLLARTPYTPRFIQFAIKVYF
jgi:outer membrane receptor protein involved in Fe transport